MSVDFSERTAIFLISLMVKALLGALLEVSVTFDVIKISAGDSFSKRLIFCEVVYTVG